MPEIHLQKTHGMLAPADEDALEIINQMKQGQVIRVKFSFPRNYGNHKRFFKFINITFDIQDHFDNIKHYRKWLIGKAGYYTIITCPNGNTIFDTDSIAFDKMEEPEFRKCFLDCINAFLNEWEHRISRDELYQVVDFI